MENLALPPPLYAVDQVGFPLLSLMIFLPLLAGIVVGFVQDALIARRMGLIVCALEIALALLAVVEFDRALPSMQLMEDAAWIPSLNVRYQLGVDGISILFLPLTTLLFAAVLAASWASVRSMVGLHVGLLLVLQSVTLGVFCALDLVLFFVFWELTLVPVYFLITLWGIGPERRFAGMKYTLMMLAGGIPLLLGIVLLALNHATQVNQSIPDGLSFSYLALIATPLPARISEVVFALLFIGFAVKAPLFPFHTWLPKVAMEGPPGVSAILVGLKLGAFGILRFAIPLAPEAFREAAWLVGALGAVGVVYGGLLALNQTNLRRMLAFSSVSHVGLVMVGIAAMNVQGLHGAIYQTLNFAIISAGIFLAVGFVHHRLGSTDMASLGGVATAAPLLSAFFVLLGVASIGVPGTNGFVAENLLLVGAAKSHLGLAFATLLGIVLGAAYVLTFFRRALFGPVTHRAVAAMADLQVRERWVLAGGALLVLTGGLFPQTVLSVFAGAAEHWLARLG